MLKGRDSSQLKIIDFGLSRRLCSAVECRDMVGTAEFVGLFTALFLLFSDLLFYFFIEIILDNSWNSDSFQFIALRKLNLFDFQFWLWLDDILIVNT